MAVSHSKSLILGSMVETDSYIHTMPSSILRRYKFLETRSATSLAAAVCPDEFADICQVLDQFTLSPQLLLAKGGNRGAIPHLIDEAFEHRGWQEARIDLFRRTYLFRGQNATPVADDPLGERADAHCISDTYQTGYSVDNFKGRVALDVEWNPKDGNLDRDFSAYRAWHEEGVIDVAFLITRVHADTRSLANSAWSNYISMHPQYAGVSQTVDFKTTTTANFEKARERILRGDLGTCPILLIGVGEPTWDGAAWDGRGVFYDKNSKSLYLDSVFAPGTQKAAFPYLH